MFSSKSCPLLGNYPDALDYKEFSAELFLPTCCLQRQNNSEERSEERERRKWNMNLKKKLYRHKKNWVSTHFCNKGEDDCDFESFVQVEFLPSFNFTVGSLICQQQNLTWGGHLQFSTLGSSDCKHHEPMELIFLRKSANQNAHFPPNFQYKFGIWESEVDIWILKYQGMYQMHFHLWLIDWESNPVLKWNLLLSWAMIHRQDPILIRSSWKSRRNI